MGSSLRLLVRTLCSLLSIAIDRLSVDVSGVVARRAWMRLEVQTVRIVLLFSCMISVVVRVWLILLRLVLGRVALSRRVIPDVARLRWMRRRCISLFQLMSRVWIDDECFITECALIGDVVWPGVRPSS